VVVINQVLACNATLGYEEVYNTQVHKFNGSPVRNLRQLTEMVGACTETHMRFDVDYGVSCLGRLLWQAGRQADREEWKGWRG
jgi:hypothetical protein